MRFAASSDDATPEDDLVETVNLAHQDTGISGIVTITTAVRSARPFVVWYPGRPAPDASRMAVSIATPSLVTTSGLPIAVVDQMRPVPAM